MTSRKFIIPFTFSICFFYCDCPLIDFDFTIYLLFFHFHISFMPFSCLFHAFLLIFHFLFMFFSCFFHSTVIVANLKAYIEDELNQPVNDEMEQALLEAACFVQDLMIASAEEEEEEKGEAEEKEEEWVEKTIGHLKENKVFASWSDEHVETTASVLVNLFTEIGQGEGEEEGEEGEGEEESGEEEEEGEEEDAEDFE